MDHERALTGTPVRTPARLRQAEEHLAAIVLAATGVPVGPGALAYADTGWRALQTLLDGLRSRAAAQETA